MNKKPFYKQWSFLIIGILTILLILQTFSNNHKKVTVLSDKAPSSKVNKTIKNNVSSQNKNVSSKSPSSTKDAQSLNLDGDTIKTISTKKYDLNFSDDSWNGALVDIKSVEVFKTEPFTTDSSSKNKAQGIIIVNMAIKSTMDLYTSTGSALLITNDGQQIETSLYDLKNYKENPNGQILNNVKKDGSIIFPIEKLNEISDLKDLRLKFNIENDNDSDDDHDYDLTINLT